MNTKTITRRTRSLGCTVSTDLRRNAQFQQELDPPTEPAWVGTPAYVIAQYDDRMRKLGPFVHKCVRWWVDGRPIDDHDYDVRINLQRLVAGEVSAVTVNVR